MPTVLRKKGYRFYFYALEGSEAPHAHVDKGSGTLKLWLSNLAVAYADNLKPAEIREALNIAHTHHKLLLDDWYEFSQRKS